MKHRLLGAFLALCMAVSLFPPYAAADTPEAGGANEKSSGDTQETAAAVSAYQPPDGVEILETGSCGGYGSDITYTIYSDRTMVISGSGYMDGIHSSSYSPPWLHIGGTSPVRNLSYYIHSVTVEEGVKSL